MKYSQKESTSPDLKGKHFTDDFFSSKISLITFIRLEPYGAI